MSALQMPALVGPHPGFRMYAAANGNWIVEGPRCGGVFVDERSAERFVHEEERAATVEPLAAAPLSVMVRTR